MKKNYSGKAYHLLKRAYLVQMLLCIALVMLQGYFFEQYDEWSIKREEDGSLYRLEVYYYALVFIVLLCSVLLMWYQGVRLEIPFSPLLFWSTVGFIFYVGHAFWEQLPYWFSFNYMIIFLLVQMLLSYLEYRKMKWFRASIDILDDELV